MNNNITTPNNAATPAAKKAPQLPSMRQLPLIMRIIMAITPPQLRIAMWHSMCVALCCLATRVRFHYTYDTFPHALLLKCLVEAEQSGGKSFARTMIDGMLMKPLKDRDDDQRRKEQDYRELKQRTGKNETLPAAPKTTIRTCPIAISIAMLVKRADAPQRYFGTPLTLWSFTEEMATVVESNRRAFANIRSIERTSYDLGSTYGNDYLSDQAYSATVDIMQCSLYLGTPNAIDAYADNSFIEGGGVTRTIFVKLPGSLGDEAPEFKHMSNDDRKAIDDMLKLMDDDVYATDGTIQPEHYINMRWLDKTVRRWCDEQRNKVLMNGSLAHDTFYKRSSVSAFREAALCAYLYSLEGVAQADIERRCRQIYLYAAENILDSMLSKWGKRFEDLSRKRMNPESQTRVSVFDKLDNTFTREQLDQLLKQLQLTTQSKVFVSKWKAKGWVKETEKMKYQKVMK
ncbi:MAG: hypothetical protein PUD51_11180 [Prevotellaceae bacterium]|nr:hypothetical protein [Prevotellaceae bacterium]